MKKLRKEIVNKIEKKTKEAKINVNSVYLNGILEICYIPSNKDIIKLISGLDDIENIAKILPNKYNEELYNLVNNSPVLDGDVISKKNRNDLIRMGLATYVAIKGKLGYVAATVKGYYVNKQLSDRNE